MNTGFVKKGNKVFISGFSKETVPISKDVVIVDNVLGVDIGDSAMQICLILTDGETSILKNPQLKMKVTYRDVFGRTYTTLFEDCKNIFKCGNV